VTMDPLGATAASMSIDWEPLRRLVAEHRRFLVTTHVRPDGDALGSAAGMAGTLAALGKDVQVVVPSPIPPRYDFLDPDRTLFHVFGEAGTPSLEDRDALVILDLSSWSQLGRMTEWVRGFRGARAVIDHHVSEDDMGAIVFKDVQAEAAGLLVYEAARALDVALTPRMANALFTALAMDTGWFAHANTRARTLRVAAELIESGADAHRIHHLLFKQNTIGRLRMMGEALTHLSTTADGRVAYAVITLEALKRNGAVPPDTEDLVDFTISLQGVEVGLLFIEQREGTVKASLRSGVLDCAEIAKRFGGGGHRAAAGATVPGPVPEAVERVVTTVRDALARS
jgi:phosphoesterase RecJ-like protein